MKLIVYSDSRSFEQFLSDHLDFTFEFYPHLRAPSTDPEQLYLLHMSGMELDCNDTETIQLIKCRFLPTLNKLLIYMTHLAVAEYWRWWVVHLWVEGFFEVFATVVIAFLFVRLGLLKTRLATGAGPPTST